MIPDSQAHSHTELDFLAKEEFSTLDPELFSNAQVALKLKTREALLKRYLDVRKLAQVASRFGKNSFTPF